MSKRMIAMAAALALLGAGAQGRSAMAQTSASNFSQRQAVIINNAAPRLELSGFAYENRYRNSSTRLSTDLKWKNTGDQAITAFEVVLLYYDPFNRPMQRGGRWLITGHDSANWAPLRPGESAFDGLWSFDDEAVMTAIVYVRAIRYEDGTVWTSNQAEVEQKIRTALPVLKEIGPIDPGPAKPKSQ